MNTKTIFIFGIILALTGCQKTNLVINNNSEQNESVEEFKTPEENSQKYDLQWTPGTEKFSMYIPTIMFHYIEDISPDNPDQLRYNLSFSPNNLEAWLKYLAENNIQTLTFWDLKDIINGKKQIPDKAVILTFDDGYSSQYDYAYRLLKKYNMKGVFFIISGKPDKDNQYATWGQIIEMADYGMEIGSHTVNHPALTNLSNEEIAKELVESKETIESKINQPVISLCYPTGKYNEQVISITEKYYLFSRTTNPGSNFAFDQRLTIPTNRVFPTTGIEFLQSLF